jgi:hypothetical protein
VVHEYNVVYADDLKVGRFRLSVSKPVLKAKRLQPLKLPY